MFVLFVGKTLSRWLSIDRHTCWLAIYIAEKYTNVASQRPDYRGGLPIARLRKIEDYVRAHLAESISIEMLAELAELSPFHFSRVSKEATGMTPLQFVIRERMLQAQQLIRKPPAASSKSHSKSATRVQAISLPNALKTSAPLRYSCLKGPMIASRAN